VATSFSIARSRCSDLAEPHLRNEIHSHTGSEAETSSILRSMERFGQDKSIRYYEMTPTPARRVYHTVPTFTWSVRAVR